MSLDVLYRVYNKEKLITLPMAELNEISSLCPDAQGKFDVIFMVDDFGIESKGHNKKELLSNIDDLLHIVDKLSKNSYKYSISFLYAEDTFFDKCTNMTGFKIKGKEYQFESGSNKCELTNVERDNEGKIINYGEIIDIRSWKFIETDDDDKRSSIKINKCKTPFELKNKLKKLKEFLEAAKDEEVTITLY